MFIDTSKSFSLTFYCFYSVTHHFSTFHFMFVTSQLVCLRPVLCLDDIFVSLSLKNLTLKILTYETRSGTRVSSVEKNIDDVISGHCKQSFCLYNKRKITRWLTFAFMSGIFKISLIVFLYFDSLKRGWLATHSTQFKSSSASYSSTRLLCSWITKTMCKSSFAI